MGLCIAGRIVDKPMSMWRDYARQHPQTILEYDLGSRGYPNWITVDEARRTKIINSRISDSQCDDLIARAVEPQCPWTTVPENASLADADPAIRGGLFDEAATLYWYFTKNPIPYVRVAKVHKALHIKRPDLYPILDARLRNLYRQRAKLWVIRLERLNVKLKDSPPYWAAIRQDLLGNQSELDDYRRQLAADPDAAVRRMANLCELRLLDIIAWSIAA